MHPKSITLPRPDFRGVTVPDKLIDLLKLQSSFVILLIEQA